MSLLLGFLCQTLELSCFAPELFHAGSAPSFRGHKITVEIDLKCQNWKCHYILKWWRIRFVVSTWICNSRLNHCYCCWLRDINCFKNFPWSWWFRRLSESEMALIERTSVDTEQTTFIDANAYWRNLCRVYSCWRTCWSIIWENEMWTKIFSSELSDLYNLTPVVTYYTSYYALNHSAVCQIEH